MWVSVKPVFWILLLLSLASGLSAWIGNDWGKQIGKRKLSVFALRPKHTSTFLTIVLSIAISLGLFGIYLVFDGGTREALLDPEKQIENQSEQIQSQQAQFASVLQNLRRAQKNDAKVMPSVFIPSNERSSKPANQPFQTALLNPVPLSTRSFPTAANATKKATQAALKKSTTKTNAAVLLKSHSAISPAGQETDKASLPVTQDVTAPAIQPLEPDVPPETIEQNTQTVAAEVLSEPIFSLELSGNKTAEESKLIIDGILSLARTYAQDMGIQSSQSIQFEVQNIQSTQIALEKALYYQLNVQAAPVQNSQQALPIKLSLQAQTRTVDFDPHQILEQNRLEPPQGSKPLQHDLQASILALAEQNQAKLILNSPVKPSVSVFLAELPFYILDLHRSGPTLKGQLVLSQSP